MICFSKEKFLSLTEMQKHKWAAKLAKACLLDFDLATSQLYANVCKWLNMSTSEDFKNRYYEHLRLAGICIKEHELLNISQLDTPSEVPFLPITIYLDHLRIAQNVGSIIRTTEAFRLGDIYFSPSTPFIDQKKVKDTGMGAYQHVHCHTDHNLIKKPMIALETSSKATAYYDFTFPKSFTLVLGNEEDGISDEVLNSCTNIINIPLGGMKNSINVAAAFSIIAAEIRRQYRY